MMSHCETPCDTAFINLNGEHDWGILDPRGGLHCTICNGRSCRGRRDLITNEMLCNQRLDYIRHYHQSNIHIPDAPWGTMDILREFRQSANYFAPNSYTMYDIYEGNQKRLWNNRWDDGAVWSAFKNRDIKNSHWLRNLNNGR